MGNTGFAWAVMEPSLGSITASVAQLQLLKPGAEAWADCRAAGVSDVDEGEPSQFGGVPVAPSPSGGRPSTGVICSDPSAFERDSIKQGTIDQSSVDLRSVDQRSVDQRSVDPLRAESEACLDGLEIACRLEHQVAALKAALAARYVEVSESLEPPEATFADKAMNLRSMIAEVACVMTVSGPVAGAFLEAAQQLTSALPLTRAALVSGDLSWQHARTMVEETADLECAAAGAFESHFLDPTVSNPARGCPISELTPGRFRVKARIFRERDHPESIEKRHAKCISDRHVEYTPARDGMAWLSLYLGADTASGIWERTTSAARALQNPDEVRTLPQLRADIAAHWLLDSSTGIGADVPAPRAQVLVTVPVFSLMGLTEEPATLDGYGPVPATMARHLVANGADSFLRVLVDPRSGAPLEIGRNSYRVPKAMRQWLRMRDGKCPFPGCSSPSLDNDADHLLAWHNGGHTGIANLGQPCHQHHQLKHNTTWTPTPATEHDPPGWISPAGRTYQSESQDWEPPEIPHPDPVPI